MGWWSAYFLGKLALYELGYLGFHAWSNLALAVFTSLPPRNSRQRFTQNLLAVPVGILLLYYDSWLPPLAQGLAQLRNLSAFSSAYLWELAGRLISWKLLLELAAMFALYVLARRKIRMSTFAFIGIMSVMIAPHVQVWSVVRANMPSTVAAQTPTSTAAVSLRPEALDARLAQFYSEQAKIRIRFTRAAPEDAPFDILILHVCSLSWDDLSALRLDPAALLGHFDLVLTGFNSAASYSGPAAIRLLRGNCGQTAESQLYDPAGEGCFVMDGLQRAGFEPHWVMNHDGRFGNFFGDVRDRGGLAATLEENTGATPAQKAFDGSPVYSDYSVLSRWWARRLANPAPRVALYYNTITLHDGNHVLGSSHPDSSYGARFMMLSADIQHFLEDLRVSGRHVAVVLVAEHGAALGNGRGQIQGLREIPTAAIAHVPVAIALINAARPARAAAQEKIDVPVSYPGVNQLLAQMIGDNPFGRTGASVDAYAQGLPQAEFVAENNGTLVLQAGAQYMMRSPDGAWSTLETP